MRFSVLRSEDAFLENQNGIYSFKRTLFSMLNNCISGVIETALLNVITVKKNSVIRAVIQSQHVIL